MLSIRLTRTGKKKAPMYRVVVMDKRRDPWAKAIEILGTRNPRTKETILKTERIQHWLSKGAQPSETIWNLFVEQKIIEEKKRPVTHLSKKRRGKMEEQKAEKEKAAQEKAAKEAAQAAKEESTSETTTS